MHNVYIYVYKCRGSFGPPAAPKPPGMATLSLLSPCNSTALFASSQRCWMEANELQLCTDALSAMMSALDSCTSRPSFMRRARI